ncbi:MAG: cysteine desulfurase [Clostridiales Family XIII bacterium]|nr:cysteine desulfurase [Clostridiales Family XIII bacterium]
MRVYLDNSATTRTSEEVAAAVCDSLTEYYGNPASVHEMGRDAERNLKQARHRVAFVLGTMPRNIIFTGSGTEADNLALHAVSGNPAAIPGKKILISAVEHPAIREPAARLEALGAEVVRIPVLKTGDGGAQGGNENLSPGLIDMDFLGNALNDKTALVSVMHVNNETGVIQPIGEICKLRALGAGGERMLLHSDAAQSFCKLPINTETGDLSRVDMITLSAHKIHGPKGVGALYAAKPQKLVPLIRGGGQEFGARSGTQNMPGIVGFGMAAHMESADILLRAKQAAVLRQRLLDGIMGHIGDVTINSPMEASPTGRPGFCSPYILSVGFLGTRGEVLVHDLERQGIFVSTGAACSSLKKDGRGGNPVLAAFGFSREAIEGTLRFSFSRYNTAEEIDYVLECLKPTVERFRKVGGFR